MESNSEYCENNNEYTNNYAINGEEQYQKGLEYMYGNQGVNQNLRTAFNCFLKAAGEEHTEALYRLGWLYMYGEPSILRNYTKAIECLESSAKQGLAVAQFQLFQCYFNGYGVEQNINEAIKYCKLAANQELLEAQLMLGDFYRYGLQEDQYGNITLKDGNTVSTSEENTLLPQDIKTALKWYDKARKQGNQLASIKYWGAFSYSNSIK